MSDKPTPTRTKRATVDKVVSELLDIRGLAERYEVPVTTVRTFWVPHDSFPAHAAKFGQSKVWWIGDTDPWFESRPAPGRPSSS